jgi:hypothetical protein
VADADVHAARLAARRAPALSQKRRVPAVIPRSLPGTPGLAYTSRPIAGVAQLVEQSLRKREVGGSSPSTGTT